MMLPYLELIREAKLSTLSLTVLFQFPDHALSKLITFYISLKILFWRL